MSNVPVPFGLAEIVKVYGNPGSGSTPSALWQANNLVQVDLPYYMRASWGGGELINKITVHRHCAADIRAIFVEIYNSVRVSVKREKGFNLSSEEYDELTAAKLKELGLDRFGGTYNHRKKRGSDKLSTHAWGIAIDIDPARNAMGDTTPSMPGFVVDIFERYGWLWGGRWKGKQCDGMHFQRARGY